MQDRLRALITRHCETLQGSVAQIAACLRPSNSAAIDMRTVGQLISITHQIKGSGGSIGFPGVSVAAAELEVHLKVLAAADGHLTPELKAVLANSVANLERVADGLAPQESTLFNVNFEHARSLKSSLTA